MSIERIRREIIHPERQKLLEHVAQFTEKIAVDLSAREVERAAATFWECVESLFDLEFPNQSIRHRHLGEVPGISLRSLNLLEQFARVEKIADVMAATREELLGVREFGNAHYTELMEAIARYTYEQCKRREAMALRRDR